MTLAFIGVGFSAHSIIYNLDKYINDASDLQILLFDKGGLFGYGVPYNTNIDHVLLNRPSEQMALDFKKINEFHDFLGKDESKNNFHARKIFGDYLKLKWNLLISKLEKKNIKIVFVSDNVNHIIKINEKFSIATDNSGVYYADITILSSGNNNQKNIFNLNSSRYVNNIYEEFHKLKQIKLNHNVLILGTGLSAIDCINFLTKNLDFKGVIYCFSRTGMIPSTRCIRNSKLKLIEIPKLLNKATVRILDILKALNKECKLINYDASWRNLFTNSNYLNQKSIRIDMELKENIIQDILLSMNDVIEIIWLKMSVTSKNIFINKYYRMYMMQRNPMPKQSALMLLNLMNKGQVKFIADKIDSIDSKSDTFLVKAKNKEILFDYVLNSTGQDLNLSDTKLYNNLLNDGLISKNVLGSINVCRETQRTINKHGQINNELYCIGPKTIGTYVNVNSAELISYKAEEIAKLLVDSIRQRH